MASAVQAPASAEGPTQHTQNQADRLTPYQLRMLHKGIASGRIQHKQGQAHVEAWDVRRHLIRIFGFGGYSIETVSLDLVAEREKQDGDRSRWTVVYRAQVRLTLYRTDGSELTHFEDGAAGDAINQPKLGDAHDMAMKTALSQALKRCATNLGDQFGLSLYNGGRPDPVVNYSAAHPPQDWQPKTEPPAPEPEDPPVLAEPQPATAENTDQAPTPTRRPQPPQQRKAAASAGTSTQPAAPSDPAHLNKLIAQSQANWNVPTVLAQVKEDARHHGMLKEEIDGPAGRATFGSVLDTRIAELAEQRNAA